MAATGGPLEAGRGRLTPRERRIAGIAVLLMLIAMPIGYLPGTTGEVIGGIVLTLLSLAVTAAIFLWLIPRQREPDARPTRIALILGIVAIVTVLVFWTALPFAFGAGAIALGLIGWDIGALTGRQGHSTAAIVLGALAIAIAFVALLFG
jgi:hypothetical protein